MTNKFGQTANPRHVRSFAVLLLLILVTLALPSNGGSNGGSKEEAATSENMPQQNMPQQKMTNERMGAFLLAIDPELAGSAGNWQLKVRELPVYVITDAKADRMRIMIPVAPAADLDADELYRLMQANFESALDARYAIADKLIWSAYIHPLSPLDGDQLASALAQTYNVAATFGDEYSSGLFSFGGGDNAREVFEEIYEKGLSL